MKSPFAWTPRQDPVIPGVGHSVRRPRFFPVIAAPVGGILILACMMPQARGALIVIESADFSNSQVSPTVFESPLGTGDNIITGTLPGSSTIPDIDAFLVANPAGLTINSITISFSNFDPSVPARPATVSLLGPNSGSVSADGAGDFLLPAVINNPATLSLRLSGPGQPGSEFITAGSASYTVTINAIPEPNAAAFVIAAGSAWMLRRTRRAEPRR